MQNRSLLIFFYSTPRFSAAASAIQNKSENKALGGKISMAEKPSKLPKARTKFFTLTKWPEFCEMTEEDI